MVVADLINEVQYMRMGKKTTICLITLDNGFEVVGTSACVNLDDYDYEIGKEEAKKDAINKLGDIEGFILTEHIYNARSKQQGE